MKVFLAQRNPIIGDIDGNTAKILESIEEGKRQGADIVMFGELVLCGYSPEDLVYHQTFIDSMELHLARIIKASTNIAVIVGMVRRNLEGGEKHLFNSAAVIDNGRLLGFQDKWLLPTYDVFEEKRYFESGKKMDVWTIRGKRVGLIICEDIWQHAGYITYTQYKRDPIDALESLKPELLLNISASPFQSQKGDLRFNVCAKAAKTLKCPVIMCCQVGANGGIVFDGYSLHVNAEGQLCHLAKGFEEDALLIDTDVTKPINTPSISIEENLVNALVLGIKDYFHKLGFKKGCIGISGGIDSALVAYLTTLALGPDCVVGVSMPSPYTSKESKQDARQLTKNLGIEYLEIPIDEAFAQMQKTLETHFHGKPSDATEENLQARIRGLFLMALANKHGYIVLNAGNKSELGVGYSTLYGDMCGSLSVIGDVTKTKIYELATFINQREGKEIIPNSILTKAPSAELRPNQKDSDELPPYDVVDAVLEGYVENYLSIDQICQKYQLPHGIVFDVIHKIHRAEYKRRQGPPVIRVSKKSFGVGRRYPIVQQWW